MREILERVLSRLQKKNFLKSLPLIPLPQKGHVDKLN